MKVDTDPGSGSGSTPPVVWRTAVCVLLPRSWAQRGAGRAGRACWSSAAARGSCVPLPPAAPPGTRSHLDGRDTLTTLDAPLSLQQNTKNFSNLNPDYFIIFFVLLGVHNFLVPPRSSAIAANVFIFSNTLQNLICFWPKVGQKKVGSGIHTIFY